MKGEPGKVPKARDPKSKAIPRSQRVAGRFIDISSPQPTLLPGGAISILNGATGVGKSVLLAWMLRRIVNGEDLFGFPTKPPPSVGVIFADRAYQQSKHWLDVVGLTEDEDTFRIYNLSDDGTLDYERFRHRAEHPDLFREAIIEGLNSPPPGSLVVVDPILPYLGSKLHDYSEVFVGLSFLSRIARENRVSILATTHVKKQVADPSEKFVRARDRAFGSTAMGGYSCTAMYLMSPEETGTEDPYYLFGYDARTLPPGEVQLLRSTDGMFYIPSPEERSDIDGEAAVNAEMSPLLSLLPNPDEDAVMTKVLLHSAEVHLNMGRRTVFRMLDRLKELGLIVAVGRGLWRKSKPPEKQ